MQASSSSSAGPRRARNPFVLLLLITITGCSEPEVERAGTWQPTGANDQNLRAMLTQPQDAYTGRAALTSRGDTGARAVTRLLLDKRRPLLNVSVSKVGSASDSPGDTALPAGATGGAAPAAQ